MKKEPKKKSLTKLRQNGFTRLRVDGQLIGVEEITELDKNKKHDIDIVIDRIIVKPESRSRIF